MASLPRVGDCVDQYEIVGELACGGMAAVYAVRRSGAAGVSRLLAMKLMLPHLRRDPERVKMFLDEARIAARIQHPNVVQVIDVGEIAGSPMLVMELVRGRSLQQVVRRARGRGVAVPVEFSLAVLSGTAAGLHAAHETTGSDGESLEIVHRDVNPRNILIGHQGEVKLVDFGIARARGRLHQTRTGELLATLRYVAPEQVDRTSTLDRRADIWSLGVVAWELLAGQDLFPDDDEATTLWNVLHHPVPDLRRVAALPDDVAAAVAACLQRLPDRRTRGCDQVAEAMAGALRRCGQAPASAISSFMAQLYEAESAFSELELVRRMTAEASAAIATTGEHAATDRQVTATAPLAVGGAVQAPPGARRLPRAALAAGAALVIAVAGLLWFLRSTPDAATGSELGVAARAEGGAAALDATSPGGTGLRATALSTGEDGGSADGPTPGADQPDAQGGVREDEGVEKPGKPKRRRPGRRSKRPRGKRESKQLMENPF